MRRYARNPEVVVVQNPASPFSLFGKGKTMRRKRYNRKRKSTRRNRGRRKSAWLVHATKFLRAGKTLKQAKAAYRKR